MFIDWIENLTWNETRDDRNDDDEQDDDENDFKMELLPEGPGQDEKKIINPKKGKIPNVFKVVFLKI